jgi:hypothetical protein
MLTVFFCAKFESCVREIDSKAQREALPQFETCAREISRARACVRVRPCVRPACACAPVRACVRPCACAWCARACACACACVRGRVAGVSGIVNNFFKVFLDFLSICGIL